MKLPFALWTREAVYLAIKKKFGVVLPMRILTDYLKRWGFTPQKPVKRTYEQDSKRVQAWLGKEYPAIAARAKEEKAEIHWGDETGIHNTTYNAKGFAPKGEPPVIRLNAKKCRVNMISSITNNGKVSIHVVSRDHDWHTPDQIHVALDTRRSSKGVSHS